MNDHTHLPTPITILLDRQRCTDGIVVSDDYRNYPTFEVTSREYPGLTGTSWSAEAAVAQLLQAIEYAQPLAPEVVASLARAGYASDVVAAWDAATRYRDDRSIRYDPEAAVSVLTSYVDAGLPPLVACEFAAVITDPDYAAQIHAAGLTLNDVHAYHDLSATDRWWQWDFEVRPWLVAGFPYERGQWYALHCSVEEAMAWEPIVEVCGVADDDISGLLRLGLTRERVAAGFPTAHAGIYARHQVATTDIPAWHSAVTERGLTDSVLNEVLRANFTPAMVAAGFPTGRAKIYADARASTEQVVEWEAVVSACGLSDRDLIDILRAGLPASAVREQALAAAAGSSVGDAARTLLALTTPPREGPWADPYASGEEPPF